MAREILISMTLIHLALSTALAQENSQIKSGHKPNIARACEVCHGRAGNSTVPTIPRLNGQQAAYIIKRWKVFIQLVGKRSGHNVDEFEGNDEMLSATASYFAAQPALQPAPTSLAAMGKLIYEKGIPAEYVLACRLCHGARGEGHEDTPRLAGQHFEYLKKQLFAFSIGSRENDLMHPNSMRMTGNEIEAIASYLAND